MSSNCVGVAEISLLPIRTTVYDSNRPCSTSFLEDSYTDKREIDEMGIEIATIYVQGGNYPRKEQCWGRLSEQDRLN